jgi:hypothetical protein
MVKQRVMMMIFAAMMPLVASAGTINGVTTTPATAALPMRGGVNVTHTFAIKYYNNESIPCGATLSYEDGTPTEQVTIKQPMMSVSRQKLYTKAGEYKVTLTGTPFNGMVGCLGSLTSIAKITGGLAVVEVGPVIQNTLTLVPKITGIKITDDNNAVGGPRYVIGIEGVGDSDCALAVEIYAMGANYNYGQPLVSNKTNFGFWKELNFTVPKNAVGYHIKAHGAQAPNITTCMGSVSKDIPPPPAAAALKNVTMPKPTFTPGEALPADLHFTTAACAFDMTVGKVGGMPQTMAGAYNPSMNLHWDDLRSLAPDLAWDAGNWYVKMTPAAPPNIPAGAPVCAANPSMVYFNFKIQ